jgi:hypothetical protein
LVLHFCTMKKSVVESNSPGGRIFSAEEVQAISIPITEIEEVLKEYVRPGIFPINIVSEVKTIIAPQPIISLEAGCHINQY